MLVYEIYKYERSVRIPNPLRFNKKFTADEVDKIVMDDAYNSSTCFLFDDPVFTTLDESEARAKFEALKSDCRTSIGRDFVCKFETLEVTCFGLVTYECDEPEDLDLANDFFSVWNNPFAQSEFDPQEIGAEWAFAPTPDPDEDGDEH